MSKLLITLVLLVPLIAVAGEISDFDVATYALITKDGQPSGMQIRLSRAHGKWIMEGKESRAPWKIISCDTGCDYRKSTHVEQEAYLSSFPADMPKQFDISCIQNEANAFCKLTMKNNTSKGGYVLVALVTEKPIPMSLQRLTSSLSSKPSINTGVRDKPRHPSELR